MFKRIKREQDGATAVMVAVTLIVLIGMLVLTVDLGRLWTARRKLSTGADAAALAAAQQCALGKGLTVAQQFGSQTGNANEAGAYTYQFSPDCPDRASGLTSGAHFVTANGSEDVSLVFAPIFGINSLPATAKAVAEWGPASSVTSPVPIRISAGALEPCIHHDAGYSGSDCTFGFDNDPNDAQWGFLNFPEGWLTGMAPAVPTQNDCNAAGGASDVNGYLTGSGTPFDSSVPTDPGYVWVCAAPGDQATAIITIETLIDNLAPGDVLYMSFPVMGLAPPIVDLGGNQQALPIVGFTRLRVLGAWGNGKPWHGLTADQVCSFPPGTNSSSEFCIQTQWDGGTIVPGIPGGGLDFGLRSVRLVD